MAQKKYARRRPKPRVAGFAQDGSRLRLKPPPRSVRVRRLLSAPVRWVDWKAVGTGSATLVAVCTVVVAVATFFVSTQTLKANTREQASERFVRAIDQLGSDKTDVRLGGIYGLEQLARDSPSDQPAVFDVLSTYVREHAPSHSVKCDPDAAEFAHEPDKSPNPGEDILAVVQAIARRDARYDRAGQKISLVHTCLKYAKFSNLQLAGIELASADLGYTSFESANLARAALDGADVSDSWLVNADLQSATLSYCNFHASNLGGANLSNAILRGADMRGVSMTKVTTPPDPDNNGKQLTVGPANLTHADLQSADLSGATLKGVNFSSADLSDANLTDASLDDATFAGVHYNDATRWPAGFRPPPNKP